MGADIEGAGSSTLVVHGVEPGSLQAADHAVVADRIQAATYLAAVAGHRRRGRAPRRPGRPHGDAVAPVRRHGRDGHVGRRRLGRVAPHERLRSHRRRHAAVPGHRHRLQAADHHDAVGRRRRRHRHREPLPRSVPLRGGAAAARRRHSHRRPSRGGARCRHGSAVRRCARPTSAPARRWWSPVWLPRARPRQRRAPRRPRLRRPRRSTASARRRHRARSV